MQPYQKSIAEMTVSFEMTIKKKFLAADGKSDVLLKETVTERERVAHSVERLSLFLKAPLRLIYFLFFKFYSSGGGYVWKGLTWVELNPVKR